MCFILLHILNDDTTQNIFDSAMNLSKELLKELLKISMNLMNKDSLILAK